MTSANPRALETALWNRGGVDLTGAETADDVLTRADLNWKVEKRPLLLPNGTAIPKRFATVRTDKEDQPHGGFLGVVSNRFSSISNHECVELAIAMVQASGARFERAGLVGYGRRVFLLASLPTPVEICPGDDLVRYLLFVNAFDGSTAFRAVATPCRVSCANQIRMALTRGHGISIRHHSDVSHRIGEAKKYVHRLMHDFDRGTQMMRDMVSIPMDHTRLKEYFSQVFPASPNHEPTERTAKLRTQATERFENGLGADIPAGKHSLYRALQTAIEMVEHQSVGGRMRNPAVYSLLGSGAAVKERAFRIATNYLSASLN